MRASRLALATVIVLLLAACGGSGGPAGAPSHDSPDGAVRGLVDTLSAGDVKGAADWIAPDERSDFTGAFDAAKQLHLTTSFQVKDFAISSVDTSGDRAAVKYRGDVTACIAGPNGATGTDGSGCHPVQSQSGSQASDTFVCVRSGGQWYVSLRNTVSG